MARYDNTHSKFVALAKFVLPLASLGVLATLFLFTRTRDYETQIPYAQVDLETLAREQRLDGPAFSTVTTDGASLELSAQTVRPDLSHEDVVNSRSITGAMDLPESGSVFFEAQNAVLDGPGRIAEFSGGVLIESTTGYRMETERMAAQLDDAHLQTYGHISAESPMGQLEAGSMELSRTPETNDYVMVFKDGVKLVYQP